MRVLITGFSGFIGKAVTERLDHCGIEWTAFGGNVLRSDSFQGYHDCDTMLHLAGITRCGSSDREQKHLLDVNISSTMNAINFAQVRGMRFIFPSTASYGNPRILPVPESEPLIYHDAYSYSKWDAEHAIAAWHKLFGLEGVIFRIFNAYGPEQKKGFLISDIVAMIREGQLNLHNLKCVRDFIYIDDLAEFIVRVIATRLPGLITVNVGSGVGHSVGEVVNMFCDILGRSVPLESEERSPFILKSIANTEFAEKTYGWQCMTRLKDGIAQVLKRNGIIP